jgi:hypothetical protein
MVIGYSQLTTTAARNLLLTFDKKVKVADFGLSKNTYAGVYAAKKDQKFPVKVITADYLPFRSLNFSGPLLKCCSAAS